MRRYLPLCLLAVLFAYLTGCGEAPSRPSVITDRPVSPPKTSARYIQVPWDISLFFNIPGGAVVAGAATAATPGAAAEGDNLTGTFVNSNGFAGTLTGVLTGNLENGTFTGSLKTITQSGCPAERQFTGPLNAQTLNWSPGPHINDCGGASPLTAPIQVAAAPPTAPPPCTYSSAVSGTSFPASGGSGTVTVTAGAGCIWFATSSNSFVTLSAAQGTANGTVNFTVAANTSTTARTATLVVAGQSFTITQAGVTAPVCTYTLNDTGRTFDAAGALGGVDMRAPAGCAWTAVSDAPWLTFTSGNAGTGNGAINFAVAANPELSQRVGRITAQGQTFTVTQTGISCAYTVTPSTTSIPAAGGPATIAVVTQSTCSWTATIAPTAAWITLTSGGSGTGNGTVSLAFAANTTGTFRQGTVTVAGQSVTFTQATNAGSLTGLITNSINGQPVQGATVVLQTGTTARMTTPSDAAGRYAFPSVSQGSYTIEVTQQGFDAAPRTVVTITAGQATTFNAALVPRPVTLDITWSPNPTSVDPQQPTCDTSENYCWRSTVTVRETSGNAATITSWLVRFYFPDGSPDTEATQTRTGADFAAQFGVNPIPGLATISSARLVTQSDSRGGAIDYVFTGTDPYGRAFSFTSPRLVLNPVIFSVGTLTIAPKAPAGAPARDDRPANPASNTIRRR